MTNPFVCRQCGRSCNPSDWLCDECQAFVDEADERIENERERDKS